MLEQASEKNRVALPRIEKAWGVQLPPEKYCLTGTGWTLKDMWDSDEEEGGPDGMDEGMPVVNGTNGTSGTGAARHVDGAEEDEDGEDSYEAVFGGNGDEDQEMTEG